MSELQRVIHIGDEEDEFVSDEVLHDQRHKLRVSIDREVGDVYFEFTSRRALFDFARGLLWYMAREGGGDTEFLPIADFDGSELALNGVRLSPDSSRFFDLYPFGHDEIEGLFPRLPSETGPPQTREVWQGVKMSELAREVRIGGGAEFVSAEVLSDQRHKLRVSSDTNKGDAYIESTSRRALYDFARALLWYAVEEGDGRLEYTPVADEQGNELVAHAVRLSCDSVRLVVTFPSGVEEIIELLPLASGRIGQQPV